MKNWQAKRYRPGSAQYVVAHAQLQASRGKNPSVSFRHILNPFWALRAAKVHLANEVFAQQQLEKRVANEALMIEKKWRGNKNVTEYPSVSFMVTHASDQVKVQGAFELWINHVDSFHGKGFKPLVRHFDSTSGTGDVHVGIGEDAYDKALKEGTTLLQELITDLEKRMRAHEELEIRCHRGRR